MIGQTWLGILMPFAGTAIGAAGVFFLKKKGCVQKQRTLMGFAAGVMTAASVWSLLIPAVEQSASWGRWAFLPAAIGFAAGVCFLLLVDAASPRLLQARIRTNRSEHWRRTLLMILAVTIHNLPEGMAVGAAYAGVQSGYSDMAAGAMALSLGVAIQNFPEGAIISMPLHAAGMKKGKAFACGVLSGAVEPIGAGLTLLLSFLLVPVLPYLLAFAAGAMLVVVAQELLPQACGQESPQRGAVGFTLGFLVMMVLDVALG